MSETFLLGLLQSPLLVALAGIEFFFTRPDENWLVTVRRWLLILAALWLVRSAAAWHFGMPLTPWLPLIACFSLLFVQTLERLLGQASGEAMLSAGPLAAWLFLSPVCRTMDFSSFSAYLAGLAVLFPFLAVLKAYLYDRILRGDQAAAGGGTVLLLVMIAGLLLIASVFRGLIA